MKQEYLDAKLERYRQKEIYPFHMPGHKRKKACINGPLFHGYHGDRRV